MDALNRLEQLSLAGNLLTCYVGLFYSEPIGAREAKAGGGVSSRSSMHVLVGCRMTLSVYLPAVSKQLAKMLSAFIFIYHVFLVCGESASTELKLLGAERP